MRRLHILAPLCIALLVAACGDGRSRTLPGSSNSNNNRAACGNGVVEQGEVCDGIALGGLTCVTLGFGAGGLACTSDCRDFDRSGCGAPPTCGNGTTDGGELCDGASFGTRSCQTYGYSEGSLSCSANCGVIDTSGCSGQLAQCGNDTREGNEVCDGTDVGGATCQGLGLGTGTISCNAGCASLNTSGCNSTCTPECGARVCGPDPVCGASCGTCTDGTCNADGQCEAVSERSPRILSFTTNVSAITRGQSVTFSAIVTDPDGLADIVGGTLEGGSGQVYGTFSASGGAGAYSMSLSWNDMHLVAPIEFTTEEQRTFMARFYDVAGNQVTQSAQVRLHCNGDAACAGTCADLMTDDLHCGTCGHVCEEPVSCYSGSCVVALQWTPSQTGSCQQSCPALAGSGSMCVTGCDFGDGNINAAAARYYCTEGVCPTSFEVRVFSCTQVPPETYTLADGSLMSFDAGGCCCVIP